MNNNIEPFPSLLQSAEDERRLQRNAELVTVSVQISIQDYADLVSHFTVGRFGRPLVAVHGITRRAS